MNLPLTLHFSQRMLIGTCLGLAILAGMTFVTSVWQWHKDWVSTHPTTIFLPMIENTHQSNDLIASIPENHLFGKSQGQMPITNLQMTVTGIVLLPEESDMASKAYISIEGEPSKIYKVGDNLPYGVKIYAISHDAVILKNDGHFEKLPLPREKLKFQSRSFKERF